MVKIHFFQNMIMLHIKLKGTTSNLVANILPADPPSSPPPPSDPRGEKGQSQLYQNTVMSHIKFKGIMKALTW